MKYYSLLTTVPSLFSCITMLIYGKLSDMYGLRTIMLVAMGFYFGGSILCAISSSFWLLVASRCILNLGIGSIAPLCFSAIGDMFEPAERGKWGGLLNLPGGICAFVGPTLGGVIIDDLGWRYLFWIGVPLSLIAAGMIFAFLPSLAHKAKHTIDVLGSIILFFAISTMLLALTWAGSTYPWMSFQVLGMLGLSILLWYIFLRIENKAAEPMLAPQVLKNRVFLTAALAGFLSIFMMMGITVYYPVFLQGVQERTATVSAQAVTPYNVLVAFVGIGAGMLYAKTRKYKWMYLSGYAILTVATILMILFNQTTPLWMGIMVLTVAGLGLGAMPTINTLVCQASAPRNLIGVATGAIYFLITIGTVIAPAIQGSIMNSVYTSELKANLPAETSAMLGTETLTSLYNPNMLISADKREVFKQAFTEAGDDGTVFNATMVIVRTAMDKALRNINILSAVLMAIALVAVFTVPELSMGVQPAPQKKEEKATA